MTHVIGHKGAAALAPENSAVATGLARALGADGVEFDVRRAADGKLAVWHDHTLPDGRVLLSTPWQDLRDDVDDLTTVLDAASGLTLINVEIKNAPHETDYDAELTVAEAVADALAERPAAERAATVVSCFDLPTLDAARRRLDVVAPEVGTGWLAWLVDDIVEIADRTARHGHGALHPHHSMVTPDLLNTAHRHGLTVNCWTCNDQDRILQLAEMGTDGIITDDPKAALATLNR